MTISELYFYDENNFIWVARQLFDAELLRLHRENVQSQRDAFQPVSERDSNALNIGVAPDKIRLNPVHFELWKTLDISKLQENLPEFNQITYPPIHRVMTSTEHFTPWHQDIAYLRSLGNRSHHRILTCWLPLDDDPSILPTVQLAHEPKQSMLPHITQPGFMNHRYLAPEFEPQNNLLTFDLALGDALFFGQKVLHRTYFERDSFQSRSSFEFRLTTLDNRIDGKDYYDLRTRKFYLFKS